jgi:predicted acylesterase/phospholipase RssA
LIRAIEIQRDVIIQSNRKHADFLIEPNVGTTGLADLNKSKDCIEAGVLAARQSALELKEMILKRLQWKTADSAVGAR